MRIGQIDLLDLPPETLDRPDTVVASEPVAGFELRCVRLWSPR